MSDANGLTLNDADGLTLKGWVPTQWEGCTGRSLKALAGNGQVRFRADPLGSVSFHDPLGSGRTNTARTEAGETPAIPVAAGNTSLRVKICGVRTEHHVRVAAQAGADMVGLIFAPSKRQVTPDEARAITSARYERRPLFVGVFVDEEPEAINRIAAEAGLDLVQLSGSESPEACAVLRAPYNKVVHVTPTTSADDVLHIAERYRDAAAIVLDTGTGAGATPWGGTGIMMDLDLAAAVVDRLDRPAILAGGLRPETVAEAARRVRPWGVDVSSGVETDGSKDDAKIIAFIQSAKSPR